jgi:hypothetical protein
MKVENAYRRLRSSRISKGEHHVVRREGNGAIPLNLRDDFGEVRLDFADLGGLDVFGRIITKRRRSRRRWSYGRRCYHRRRVNHECPPKE